MFLRALLQLTACILVAQVFATDAEAVKQCNGSLVLDDTFSGSIAGRQSGDYNPAANSSCTWFINPPLVDAVPHRVELHINKLLLRGPGLLSVYDGYSPSDGVLLVSFSEIGSAMLPFVVATNNTNHMFVMLTASGDTAQDVDAGFEADFVYECMDAPAVCQQQITDDAVDVSSVVKGAFVFVVSLLSLALVVLGFLKSYRSPHASPVV